MKIEVRYHSSLLVCSRIVEFAYSVGLSTREAVVLILAAGAGMNRKEAAYRLGCRPGTVDTYWHRILRKCGVTSQLEVLAALLAFSLEKASAAQLEEPPPPLERTASALRDLVRYRAAIDSAISGPLAISTQLGAVTSKSLASFRPEPS